MKILNIILTSQNGGAEQVFIDYSRILKNKLGHDVLAVTKIDAPYCKQLENLNIPYKKIKNNFGYYDIFAINNLKNIILEFDADAIIAHAGRSMVLARKAIKKIKHKKISLICLNHSMNVKRSIGADIVISVNKEMFYRTIDAGQPEDKSFVIHNATDLPDINFLQPKIDWQNKKTITLGCIGRLDKSKGFRFAIKALKLLQDYPEKNFYLKIAGSGKREAFLRNLIKELNLEDRVEFVGWIKNKKEYFDSIDIFLLTSEKETFGLVVIEAMKFGKPVISTDADGPKEIIQNGINGLLIDLEPLDNIEIRFVDAIKKMITNSDLTNQMIEKAYEILQKRFSFECLQEKLKDIFGEKNNGQR